MNAIQTIGSIFSWIVDRIKPIRKCIRFLSDNLFPGILVPSSPLKRDKRTILKISLRIYILVFIFVFIIHAVWAGFNGRLFPDDDPMTKNFFEDWANIINYIVIVEGYFILGFLFLRSIILMKQDIQDNGLFQQLKIQSNSLSYKSSLFGSAIVLLIALLLVPQYMLEIQSFVSFSWYMASPPPDVTYNGLSFYYALINFLINTYVMFCALFFFALFQLSGQIGSILNDIATQNPIEQLKADWENENRIKALFAPMFKPELISKIALVFMTINMLTEKISEVNVSISHKLVVFAIVIFGLFLFSFPRFYIQHHIHNIWEKIGKNEYEDLRLPWMTGYSNLVDIIVLIILANYLLPNTLVNTISTFLNP